MFVTLLLKVTADNLLLALNGEYPYLLAVLYDKLRPMYNVSKGQSLNSPRPPSVLFALLYPNDKVTSESSKYTSFNDVQLLKTKFVIFVTLLGIVILAREEQALKADFSILAMLLGSEIFATFAHLRNAAVSILVTKYVMSLYITLSGITTSPVYSSATSLYDAP